MAYKLPKIDAKAFESSFNCSKGNKACFPCINRQDTDPSASLVLYVLYIERKKSLQMSEMVTFLMFPHTRTHRAGLRDRRRGEEHGMDGVSPWKWTVSCHGDWVGHVIIGSTGNQGREKRCQTGEAATTGRHHLKTSVSGTFSLTNNAL